MFWEIEKKKFEQAGWLILDRGHGMNVRFFHWVRSEVRDERGRNLHRGKSGESREEGRNASAPLVLMIVDSISGLSACLQLVVN